MQAEAVYASFTFCEWEKETGQDNASKPYCVGARSDFPDVLVCLQDDDESDGNLGGNWQSNDSTVKAGRVLGHLTDIQAIRAVSLLHWLRLPLRPIIYNLYSYWQRSKPKMGDNGEIIVLNVHGYLHLKAPTPFCALEIG